MSTRLEALAEDDDRRVGDDRGLVGASRRASRRRRRACSSSASRVSRISRRGARSAISLARPVLAAGAEPDQALDVEREARVERLQPPLGAELEERVGLEPRLLGLAVLAGADGGLHAVERERDQVVVGLVGRLLSTPSGIVAVERVLDPRRSSASTSLGGRHALVAARSRSPTIAPSSVERRRDRARCAPGRAWRAGRAGRRTRPTAPVRNATASWISKSSVTCVVLDAAAVLDRHEREEAQQLLGAAGGLLGGERRGGEAVERPRRSPRARRGRRPRRRPRRRAASAANAPPSASAAAAPRSSA